MTLRGIATTVFFAAAVLLLPRSVIAEPPPDPRLEKVFADWQNRRERIKTIRYRTSGEHVRPKGSYTDPITGAPLGPDSPPHDITWSKTITLLLDFTTNRHRLEEIEEQHQEQAPRPVPKRTATTVFDSKDLWTLFVRPPEAPSSPKAPDVIEVSGNMRGAAFPSEYWPFFLGHGIVALTTEGHILPGRLTIAPNQTVYHVHGEGVCADRPCLVLRTQAWANLNTGFDELWVDPARDSAVVRQVCYVNEAIFTDIQIDYQQTAGGWLPQSWTVAHAHPDNQIASIDRMRVDQLDIDLAATDADFHIDVKPGMIVQHSTVAGSPDEILNPKAAPGKLFKVEDGGSWKPISKSGELTSRWPFIAWAWGISVAVAAIGAALVFWWRRKRRRTT